MKLFFSLLCILISSPSIFPSFIFYSSPNCFPLESFISQVADYFAQRFARFGYHLLLFTTTGSREQKIMHGRRNVQKRASVQCSNSLFNLFWFCLSSLITLSKMSFFFTHIFYVVLLYCHSFPIIHYFYAINNYYFDQIVPRKFNVEKMI